MLATTLIVFSGVLVGFSSETSSRLLAGPFQTDDLQAAAWLQSRPPVLSSANDPPLPPLSLQAMSSPFDG